MDKEKDTRAKKVAPKVVLVLGAGGSKGFAHIGVLEVLQKAGIPIDCIIGCSIGSVIGVLYADGKAPEEILKIGVKFMPQGMGYHTLGLPHLLRGMSGNGFFNTSVIHDVLERELQARTFEELKIPFQVVSTDLHKATLEVFNEGPLLKPVCASSAIPVLFQAVEINKKKYVDGAMISELPIYVAQKTGAKLIIGSNIKGYIDIEDDKDFSSIGKRSYYVLRDYFDKEEESKADITIRPDLAGVRNVIFSDPETMHEVYERGKKCAQAQLPRIQALLQKL